MPPGATGVFLADFGLAKNVATGSKYTKTGETLGTPQYMSPEQARGELGALAPASDVWALGCVLYELLTGREPFDGPTHAAVIGKVLTSEPPRPRSIVGTLPAGAETAVRVCLAKQAAGRYADGAALRDDLQRALDDRPLLARAPRRSRATVWAAVAAGAAAVPLIAAWAMRPTATPPPTVASADSRVELLARRGWEQRTEDPAAGAALLAQALESAPDKHVWRVRLGLLRWTMADWPAALAAFHAVPPRAPEFGLARWLAGFLAYNRFLATAGDHPTRRWGQQAQDDLRDVAGGATREARLARAVLHRLANEDDAARTLVAGLDGWDAALLRGLLAQSAGDHAAAEREYTAALAGGVASALVLSNRAGSRDALGDGDGELADLNAAIALAPAFPTPHNNRGVYRMRHGDLAGGVADLTDAIRLRPGYTHALMGRAAAYKALGKLDRSVADLTTAIAADARNYEAYFRRATIRHGRGDVDGARADYDAALALQPTHSRALDNRGMLRCRSGDVQGGLADLNAAMAADPTFGRPYYHRARMAISRRDWDAAIADLGECVAREPDYVPAYRQMSWAHMQAGRPLEALEALDRAVRAGPDEAPTYYSRGVIRAQLGNTDGALADYDRTLALDPRHAKARVNRGVILAGRGRTAEALAEYRRARTLDPTLPNAPACEAFLLFQQRDWAGAKTAFTAFLRLQPNGPQSAAARAQLAECERRLRAAAGDR